MKAVYIHIPFCKHLCSYCDFCKVLHIDSFVNDYLEALQREIEDSYDGERIETIYIGGGTPSCLTKQERVRLFRILEIFNKDPNYEYTFECNPDDITEDLLDDIVQGGVNRISIGIQSFNKKNQTILERDAEFDDINNKLNMIRRRGITNINLDLMYAIPGEDLKVLRNDVSKILKLNPTHISTYSLILEEHTKLKINNTKYMNEDLDRKMYDYIIKKLTKSGYNHYEVSNFAKDGCESKHNLNYWNNGEYYGFGLGASGYKDNFRYTNTRNIHEYIKLNFREEENLMTYKDQMDNEIMLGFRKLEGINMVEFKEKYGHAIEECYPILPLIKEKDLIVKDKYIFINPAKIYIMNEILIKLI